MSEPEIGGRKPLPIDVEAGSSYWWCACGRSKTSRSATARTRAPHSPARVQAGGRRGLVLHLQAHDKPPLCDGSHKKSA